MKHDQRCQFSRGYTCTCSSNFKALKKNFYQYTTIKNNSIATSIISNLQLRDLKKMLNKV